MSGPARSRAPLGSGAGRSRPRHLVKKKAGAQERPGAGRANNASRQFIKEGAGARISGPRKAGGALNFAARRRQAGPLRRIPGILTRALSLKTARPPPRRLHEGEAGALLNWRLSKSQPRCGSHLRARGPGPLSPTPLPPLAISPMRLPMRAGGFRPASRLLTARGPFFPESSDLSLSVGTPLTRVSRDWRLRTDYINISGVGVSFVGEIICRRRRLCFCLFVYT